VIYDPTTTFAIYIIGLLVLFTLLAVVADLWTAKAERDARRHARAEARAKRKIGERQSLDLWQ
jgi:hypothetical protein